MQQLANVDPISMLGFAGSPELGPVAEEARGRLLKVAERLRAAP